ncbi:hypothetical protein UCREL1_5757 [Eutypa lata UCREL1]|uniref:DNA mismatch repair protein HSM3 N-terminal domain-containing protein n=1 Tax=Eutypa lata (strain UCR-EL1) TaxID=1287681 RepID=M7SLI7_EUTLA|nr:hypothetical protein UCREL1_5757 [Eutypa lata UCREL1]
MDTDTIPVTGVDALEKHLDDLLQDPNLPLTVKLFDDVELQLTDANTPPLIPLLLPKLTDVLKTYQQDPSTLCSLAIKLLRPLTLTQVLSLASEDALIQALRSPAPSANLLAMAVLEKAAHSPADAAILAMMKNLVAHFVAQWLSAPQVEVGEKGSKVLGDLLDVDCDTRPPGGLPSVNGGLEIAVRRPPGQGLMWRGEGQQRLSDQQRTLAQGRLLRVLPRLAALNLSAVARTEFTDLNQRYVGIDDDSGLLRFAALHMIDYDDMLMRLNLVDFFETFLSTQRVTPFSTYKMETLRKLVRDAITSSNGGGDALKNALLGLPERTVPEEADDLRRFIRDVVGSS